MKEFMEPEVYVQKLSIPDVNATALTSGDPNIGGEGDEEIG